MFTFKLPTVTHQHRAEHRIVVSVTALVKLGKKEQLLTENQSVYIPIGKTHRLTNPSKLFLELIKVQSDSYLSEGDIARFEDVYKRAILKENIPQNKQSDED
jgi:mannose-6-phosphate isomerase-like protein (cupin superfamily)